MDKKTNSNALAKMYCSVFGHNYQMTRRVTKHVKEYTCSCCKHQLTTDGNGNLIELTPRLQEMNSALERIYQNRMARLRRKVGSMAAMY
jgi:hypothetical protein